MESPNSKRVALSCRFCSDGCVAVVKSSSAVQLLNANSLHVVTCLCCAAELVVMVMSLSLRPLQLLLLMGAWPAAENSHVTKINSYPMTSRSRALKFCFLVVYCFLSSSSDCSCARDADFYFVLLNVACSSYK